MNEKAAKLARRAARASGTMKKPKKGERGQKLPKAAKRLWNASTPAKRGEYTADWLRVAGITGALKPVREQQNSRSARKRARREQAEWTGETFAYAKRIMRGIAGGGE